MAETLGAYFSENISSVGLGLEPHNRHIEALCANTYGHFFGRLTA